MSGKMNFKARKIHTDTTVSAARRSKHGGIISGVFAVLSIAWICPLLMVLLNSFKKKAFIFKNPFAIDSKSFFGFKNYVNGFTKTDFGSAFGYSLFITVFSVAAIILCTSMTAWYIVRVKDRFTKTLYNLCLFSMIVPFQMVMFTLSKFANILHLGNPVGIILVYLGFGAGLAVFMFTGFVKSISLEIEEAAMIDGCTPIQTFFEVVLPIMKPTVVTVAILEAMWVWNDYLLPSLVLNVNKYKTIPIAVQYLKQSHGQLDWGAMMAVLVMAIVPIVIFYAAAQKYIIEGVMAGAVKG
jgi:raffinose/stachyose/melibiose transport system permease protein